MRIVHVEQGSPEWLNARLGIPTSSEFHKIINAAKGDLSRQARKYAHQLVAEILLGEPVETSISNLKWVARGKALEPQAVQQYEFTTDTETSPGGFVTTDDGRLGCSPDRLIIGARGALEIKCQAPHNHMGMLIDGPGDDYRQQVQGQLAIAELEWVDLYAFHPSLPPVTIRTYRDEPVHREDGGRPTRIPGHAGRDAGAGAQVRVLRRSEGGGVMADSGPFAYSVPQLATAWGVSTRHVYDLCASGQLGHLRVGTLIRISLTDGHRRVTGPMSPDKELIPVPGLTQGD